MAALPPEFADLEPFAAKWSVHSESERYARRIASPMEELEEFYNAAFPRIDAATEYLEGVSLDGISEQDQNLLWLYCSLVTVSFAIERWRQPRVPESGAAAINVVVEPAV